MTNKEWLDYLAHNAPDELAAWFDAEHVETKEQVLYGDTAALEAEYGKGGVVGGSFYDTPEQGEVVMPLESLREYLGAESENDDSREKLEADVYKAAEDMERFYYGERFINTSLILRWLDRQAAITEREVEHDLMKAGRMAVEVERERIKKLTAERDELQEQVDELTAERDNWKEHSRTIEYRCKKAETDCEIYRKKFGKCIDYADAVHALMDDEGMA